MDKTKLIELLKSAWNDGNSMYHDCKYSHEYKKDLDNWLDANECEINELCDSQKVENTSDKALDIADVMRSAFKEAYEHWYNCRTDAEIGKWLHAKSKGITP